jgi:hypothetical protein
MFLVTDKITREYHFALAPGPFNFGYAVDASWWPPTTTPVKNPAMDFPREANADDPWSVEFEQLFPIKEENVDKDIFKTTVHHRGLTTTWGGMIWSWDLTLSGHNPADPIFWSSYHEIIDDFTLVQYFKLTPTWWSSNGKDGMAVPGHHFGVLLVQKFETNLAVELDTTYRPLLVDIYVEG